ncbi:HepT-like ribonuclease domain-containing protein [Spirosoma fluminis]
MQPAAKTDLVYCLRILEAIGKISLYADGFDDPFVFFEANDQKDFNACLLQLLHIGEQVNRISESTKEMALLIPWPMIKGFRNLIAHDYVGIDKLIVFDTITSSLPNLKNHVEQLVRDGIAAGVFELTDYSVSKESSFYRHINFSSIL